MCFIIFELDLEQDNIVLVARSLFLGDTTKFTLNSAFTLNFSWTLFTKRSKESWTNVQYVYDKYYNVPSDNNTSLYKIYEE